MVKYKYKYKYPFKFCNIGIREKKYDTLYHKNCPCSIHGNNRNDIQSNISMMMVAFISFSFLVSSNVRWGERACLNSIGGFPKQPPKATLKAGP